MNNTVIACVDGSPSTRPVCEYAAWAAGKLGAPLALLHVLEKSETIHIPLPSFYVCFRLTVRKLPNQNSLRLSLSTFPLNRINVADAAAQAVISDMGSE